MYGRRKVAHWSRKAFVTVSVLTLVCTTDIGSAKGTDRGPVTGDPEHLVIVTYAAWVEAATFMCREDAPEISGHLIQAYNSWLERNTHIRDTLKTLKPGQNLEQSDEVRIIYERLKSNAMAIFAEKRKNDIEDFGRECDDFTKELANGEWDYPMEREPPR